MVNWDNSVLQKIELLKPGEKEIVLVANGDRRRTANLAGPGGCPGA